MLYTIACSDVGFIVRILAKLLKYIHYIIPILLIVLVIFDIAKAVVSGVDDKAKKDMSNKIITRVIYAVIIFLIPTIVFFIFDKVNGFDGSDYEHTNVSATSWYSCFRAAYNE